MVTVSTVIPTYNQPDLLVNRAIASVLALDFTDWQCIVVGDGTDDRTTAAMGELCASDPRFEFRNIPRPDYPADPLELWRIAGVDAINAGLELARGEWLSILADDDAYEPWHHRQLLESSDGVDLVWGQSVAFCNGDPDPRRVYGNDDHLTEFNICVGAFLLRASVPVRPSTVRRRSWSWDAEFWARLIDAQVPYRAVPGIVHQYHPNPLNWSHHGFGAW